MAFASGGNHGLRYIKEKEFGVTPENPTMRGLRHTSCSLALSKDSFQSEELRNDAQISDLRHGVIQNSGDIGIELSYGEYDDLLAAAVRGEWENDVLVAGIDVPTFTIEREFSDIKQYQLFTGCAVNSLSLEIQTNAMITGTISFVGKNVSFGNNSAAEAKIESQTYSPLDGFSGILREGGKQIAVITSISLSIDNGIEAANIIGSNVAAALIPGRINCTGTVSAYFENLELLNKFVDETESDLEITFGTGGPGSYIVKLPRIKYSGGDNSVDGEGPIMLDMPFQALLDECTGTNIIIERIPAEKIESEPCTISYEGDGFVESSDKEGMFDDVITATLSGGNGKKFVGTVGETLPGVRFTNIPEGIKAQAVKESDNVVKIKLSGVAKNHTADDTIEDASITFTALSLEKGLCNCAGDTVDGGTKVFTIMFNDYQSPPQEDEENEDDQHGDGPQEDIDDEHNDVQEDRVEDENTDQKSPEDEEDADRELEDV